jgi:hypothetical protein
VQHSTIRRVGESVDELDHELGSVYSIGLAEETRPTDGFALIFSIAEPDRDNAGYSVVVEPGQRATYRAVTGCRLLASQLYVSFTDEGARDLGVPSRLALDLSLSSEDVKMLQAGLERVGILEPDA